MAQLHLVHHTFVVVLEEIGALCYPATQTAKLLLLQLQAALDPSASAAHPNSKGQVTAPSGANIVTINSRDLMKVQYQATNEPKRK